MFNIICGIVFAISVVCKIYSVEQSYKRDDEFMNIEEDKDD